MRLLIETERARSWRHWLRNGLVDLARINRRPEPVVDRPRVSPKGRKLERNRRRWA
jgi:hypothetical protein